MESIGILPEYVDPKGYENPDFTVYGTVVPPPLCLEVQRHIGMLFTYTPEVLVSINQHLSAILSLAWDVTPYQADLNPILPGYHLYQLLCVLFFNHVQVSKLKVLKSLTLLGYDAILTGAQLVRLIISFHVFVLYVLSDKDIDLIKADREFVTQAVDGLQRTAHQLPEHVRAVFFANSSPPLRANQERRRRFTNVSALQPWCPAPVVY